VGQTKLRSVLIMLIYLTETRVQSGTFKGSTIISTTATCSGTEKAIFFLSRRYP